MRGNNLFSLASGVPLGDTDVVSPLAELLFHYTKKVGKTAHPTA